MGLFSDSADIKAALRLSGMPANSDGQRLFTRAELKASVTFRRALGVDIEADVAAASTLVRDQAKLAEYDLVMAYLIDIMPYASMHNSAAMDEWYNQEAPFRLMDERSRQTLSEKLLRSASDAIDAIATDLGIEYDNGQGLSCFSFGGPDDPTTCPTCR